MSVCNMNIRGFLWKNNIEGAHLMKRLFYITSVIVLSCVVASSMIGSVTTESTADTTTETTQSESGDVYVLGCDGDRIVAFVKETGRPFIETTTAVSSLPYDVQEKLRQGMEFDTVEELQAALEEYCS